MYVGEGLWVFEPNQPEVSKVECRKRARVKALMDLAEYELTPGTYHLVVTEQEGWSAVLLNADQTLYTCTATAIPMD